MEIFEVTFKGEKVKAVKAEANKIYVKLPSRKSISGRTIRQNITKDLNGWKYELIPDFDFENTFELWIRNDGRIACRTNIGNKISVSKETFNPNESNLGKLNNIVIEVYKTVEQLKAYETRDIPASTLIKLRRIKLLSTLNLLGYSNADDIGTKLDDSKMCFALSKIGKQLENYINIGAYVHVEGKEKDEDGDIIKLNIPEGMTREEFLEMIEPAKDEYSSERVFAKEQDEKRELKRDILSDYCAQASIKMQQSDWLLYARILKETGELLLELNADILEPNQKTEISDFSQLTGKELEDRISRLIDSKDFSKACEIEKRFLVREAQKLVDEIEYMLSEIGEQERNSAVGKALQDIMQEENEFIKESTGVALKKQEGISIDD